LSGIVVAIVYILYRTLSYGVLYEMI